MYCRMNVYNGNTRYDNDVEFACGCQSGEYQTLYQIVPVNVATNVCVSADNDTIDNVCQNGCGCYRRCARRRRCR